MDLSESMLDAALRDAEIPMATDKYGGVEGESSDMDQGVTLEEKLWVDECYLFQDESLTPIFCKPKLIPLKTITTQKLEQMQKEQMEKLQAPEGQEEKRADIIEEESEQEEQPGTSEQKEADVWTADD